MITQRDSTIGLLAGQLLILKDVDKARIDLVGLNAVLTAENAALWARWPAWAVVLTTAAGAVVGIISGVLIGRAFN